MPESFSFLDPLISRLCSENSIIEYFLMPNLLSEYADSWGYHSSILVVSFLSYEEKSGSEYGIVSQLRDGPIQYWALVQVLRRVESCKAEDI